MSDDITKLLNFVGAKRLQEKNRDTEYLLSQEQLELFEALVRVDEREAMVAEATKKGLAMKNEDPFEDYVRDIANDRARSST